MKVPLTGQTFSLLSDGLLEKQLNVVLAQAFRDIQDRDDLRKARLVTLTLAIKPTGDGMCIIHPDVNLKIPKYEMFGTMARIDPLAGGLMFNPHVASNPDQKSFEDLEADRG